MKKLQYFEFNFSPSELSLTNSKVYESLIRGKLFSDMENQYESEEYIQKKLFSPDNNDHFSAHQKIPEQNIKFYDFYIEEIAEGPDDFMYSLEINPVFGFFVSQKCKDLLSGFLLPSHKYYPVKIKFEETYNYYFLLIARNKLKINYRQSTFVERFNIEKEVSVNQYEDLLKLRPAIEDGSEHYTTDDIKEKVIVFDEAPDIYAVVTRANGRFYFSKRLKEALEKEKLTGFNFYEDDKPTFFQAKD